MFPFTGYTRIQLLSRHAHNNVGSSHELDVPFFGRGNAVAHTRQLDLESAQWGVGYCGMTAEVCSYRGIVVVAQPLNHFVYGRNITQLYTNS